MPAHKILIVDDNSDFREMMRYQLELWGYEVLEAGEGCAGLQAALHHSPDLLLLDYHMPDMSGIQLAKAALEQRPDLPVLFITADFELSPFKEIEPQQPHVVQKPFDMDDLQQHIAYLLH